MGKTLLRGAVPRAVAALISLTVGLAQAQTAVDRPGFVPGAAPVNGRAAARFHEPTWNELRGLSADERQLVLDYFRRINAATP